MQRRYLLEKATTPDGSTMTLYRRDDEYTISVDGRELMSTRHTSSEERLAELACARIRDRKAPRMLIGGLGLGFTLRAALRSLPKEAEVVVAELMPEVLYWNQSKDYPLAAKELDDPRTRVILTDVGRLLSRAGAEFDAILLDADNGTTAMNSAGNQRLYESRGLEQVKAALKMGGCVVYWSAQDEPMFARRMERAGLRVEVHKVRAHCGSGSTHTLLVGRKLPRRPKRYQA